MAGPVTASSGVCQYPNMCGDNFSEYQQAMFPPEMLEPFDEDRMRERQQDPNSSCRYIAYAGATSAMAVLGWTLLGGDVAAAQSQNALIRSQGESRAKLKMGIAGAAALFGFLGEALCRGGGKPGSGNPPSGGTPTGQFTGGSNEPMPPLRFRESLDTQASEPKPEAPASAPKPASPPSAPRPQIPLYPGSGEWGRTSLEPSLDWKIGLALLLGAAAALTGPRVLQPQGAGGMMGGIDNPLGNSFDRDGDGFSDAQ